MGNEDVGEHSRKSENRFNKEDGERPLKKARYVWQVKGKYHLKDSFKSANASCEAEDNSTNNDINNSTKSNKLQCDINQNNEPDMNNEVANDRCCIEALLARSETLIQSGESSDEDSPPKNIDKSISDEIPVTLVKPNPQNQEMYLRKWQARQVAKGFLDNTINRVLENWMVAPFDADDFVENCENDDIVEDEGILMAIQSHGLQSTMHVDDINLEPVSSNWSDIYNQRLQPGHSDESSVSCVVPPEIAESTLDNFQNVHNERLKQKSESISKSDANINADSLDDCIEMEDQTNFLDAAVAVAIQKKGLSSQTFS